jgi:hypothetical protein
MTWVDALRMLNILLATGALFLMASKLEVWLSWTTGMRFLALGAGLFALTSIIGSAESLTSDLPGGYRVPVLTVALAWTLAGVHLIDRPKNPPTIRLTKRKP